MKILTIGSMNLDYVYQVDHIVRPGETESASDVQVFLGGKGMNQSIAAAKAGAEVYHAGMIGEDGQAFPDACGKYGVNSRLIRKIPGKTGHTIIQIDSGAQNSILLYGGANQKLTEEFADDALSHFSAGDILLLQNEVNLLPYIVDKAFEQHLQIALNPSPFNSRLKEVNLHKISIFLLNEVEGGQITGETTPERILGVLLQQFPDAKIVLTLGADGAIYADRHQQYSQSIFPVKAVDTTAAGDTFTGYFLAGYAAGIPIPEILRICAMASSIAVSRKGAVPSIPYRSEVMEALGK